MSTTLYRRIADAATRMRDLGLPPVHETLASVNAPSHPLAGLFDEQRPRGEKPIPKRKRRYHANAGRRAERRWDGAQKMLKLLEPAGVRHDARAMDTLTRRHGI